MKIVRISIDDPSIEFNNGELVTLYDIIRMYDLISWKDRFDFEEFISIEDVVDMASSKVEQGQQRLKLMKRFKKATGREAIRLSEQLQDTAGLSNQIGLFSRTAFAYGYNNGKGSEIKISKLQACVLFELTAKSSRGIRPTTSLVDNTVHPAFTPGFFMHRPALREIALRERRLSRMLRAIEGDLVVIDTTRRI